MTTLTSGLSICRTGNNSTHRFSKETLDHFLHRPVERFGRVCILYRRMHFDHAIPVIDFILQISVSFKETVAVCEEKFMGVVGAVQPVRSQGSRQDGAGSHRRLQDFYPHPAPGQQWHDDGPALFVIWCD